MADVILFRPKILKGTERVLIPQFPMGLLFVAAPLIKNDYNVKIIDAETNYHWPEELDKELNASTICVGISSMTGAQISGGLEFSKIVKNKFNIPVVWGGLHPTILPKQTVKNNLVDIVVAGEGEEPFLQIVNALRHNDNLKGIPNIWFKENGNIYSNPKDQFVDLNTLPLPPYVLLDYEKYITMKRSYFPDCKRTLDLHTDRGCPHRCGFCYNIEVNKRRQRSISASGVLERIEYSVRRFRLDGINFIADNFFTNKKRVVDICNEIIKRKIKIDWHADCRIDYFAGYDDSFIDLLKRSGCKTLTFGIESGSPRTLNLINKDINLDDCFKVNERLRKWQIGVNYHFMVGFPEETKEDVLETYKVMLKLYKQYPSVRFIGLSMFTPYPGTPLYYKCIEKGYEHPEKLEDWDARFEWEGKSTLPFLAPDYSEWLKKSVYIAKRISLPRIGWWFRLRTKTIIKLNIIGPQFLEERLVHFIKAGIRPLKELFRLKK